ncbi:MAG: tetratricopeptide repeat protein [Acidiferrobacterales bacterium]
MRCHRGIPVILAFTTIVWLCAGFSARAEQTKDPVPLEKAFVLWQQGYLLHLMGKYEEAIRSFSQSIDEHPTAEAYTFRGWSLSMLGRLKEAIAECKQAIRVDPDYGNPYNDIGVYLIDLGRPDEAIPWLEKALHAKRYCCYEYPRFNIGRVLLLKGRVAEAKRWFENALAYEPGYEPALKALELIREHGLEPI